uniref:Uncharacterized protein n=1 Tax=Cacopsylla melanoneura TaxID=428564 RepID=A0A8D8RJ48_9HEMI
MHSPRKVPTNLAFTLCFYKAVLLALVPSKELSYSSKELIKFQIRIFAKMKYIPSYDFIWWPRNKSRLMFPLSNFLYRICLGSLVAKASVWQSIGHGFETQPRQRVYHFNNGTIQS